MHKITVMVTRHSAFYTPLICAVTGGFTRDEGIDATYAVGSPDDATAALLDGSVQVAQSAVSASWPVLERGENDGIRHFAQINWRDGFFIAAREPIPDFSWDRLAGRQVLVDHGRQPLAMFRYAAHLQGLPFERIKAIDAGGPDGIEAVFRAGQGEFAHLQRPAPQQLEADGVGYVVASVGSVIGPIALHARLRSRPGTLRAAACTHPVRGCEQLTEA